MRGARKPHRRRMREVRAVSELTAAEHAVKAEKLLARSRAYRRSAYDPDAAGSSIREGWARWADQFLSEANVHAALAVAKQEQS